MTATSDPSETPSETPPADTSPAALALARAAAINQLNKAFLEVANQVDALRRPVAEIVNLKKIIYRALIVITVLAAGLFGSAATYAVYTRRFDKALTKIAEVQTTNHDILAKVAADDKILADATGADAQQRNAAATGAAVGQLETITIVAAQCVRDGVPDVSACVKAKIPSFPG